MCMKIDSILHTPQPTISMGLFMIIFEEKFMIVSVRIDFGSVIGFQFFRHYDKRINTAGGAKPPAFLLSAPASEPPQGGFFFLQEVKTLHNE